MAQAYTRRLTSNFIEAHPLLSLHKGPISFAENVAYFTPPQEQFILETQSHVVIILANGRRQK
jgi:hypothetical protein